MRHLDLFSGIGGFALAASWVWPEHEVVAFCDIDPYATKVLNRHWPDVPVINDVRNITKDTIDGPVHLITGGFPCQPFSQAGKRKGKDDDRYLWPEMLRVITEFRPRFVLGENVSGIATIDDGMVFDQVCSDLERAGYEVWPIRVPASAVNAPHRRDRWWFAGYAADTTGERSGARGSTEQGRSILQDEKRHDTEGEPQRKRRFAGVGTEHSTHSDDAADPERGGRGGGHGQRGLDDQKRPLRESERNDGHGVRGQAEPGVAQPTADAADGNSDGPDGRNREHEKHTSKGRQYAQHDANQDASGESWHRHWLEVATEFCRVDDGVSDRMDTSDRKHRLKALGNAIVPQVAAQIMQAMKYADEQTQPPTD